MSSDASENGVPRQDENAHPDGPRKRHFRGYWNMENTKEWVGMFVDDLLPAEKIAAKVGTDPEVVRNWLKKHGVEIHQGMRRKIREPPSLSPELAALLARGPGEVLAFINERTWGIDASEAGLKQLTRFCDFVKLPLAVGLTAAAKELKTDKSMISAWTAGTKRPYLIKVADTAMQTSLIPGWKLLPMRLESGGNTQGPWIQVPERIRSYEDILQTLNQITPLLQTYERASRFGISKERIDQMRSEMFGYALGMMLGDSGKLGGEQERFTSTNLSLFFSKKHPDNEALGEFTCMCVNSLEIEMDRAKDGEPSGATRFARDPMGSFRWSSARSPLLAWAFYVGMGMKAGEKTSNDPVHMDWIFDTPFGFRKRFIQGLADSDGCARDYVVEICSVPNAQFTTRLLHSLGMSSAYTRKEYDNDIRSVVRNSEAKALPIFNEFAKGYRSDKLMRHQGR